MGWFDSLPLWLKIGIPIICAVLIILTGRTGWDFTSVSMDGGKNKRKMCYLGLLGLLVGSLVLAGLVQHYLM
jgi:hypothetical protein